MRSHLGGFVFEARSINKDYCHGGDDAGDFREARGGWPNLALLRTSDGYLKNWHNPARRVMTVKTPCCCGNSTSSKDTR